MTPTDLYALFLLSLIAAGYRPYWRAVRRERAELRGES